MADDNVDFVGAVYLLRADGSVLLQHRDNIANLRHADMWVPPGGHADPGESPVDCARREFLEETGYHCDQLHYLTVLHHPAENGWRAFRLHVFWAVDDGLQDVTCREGQAVEFIPRQQADKLLMPPFVVPLWDQALTAFAQNSKVTQACLPISERNHMKAPSFTVPYSSLNHQVREVKDELMNAVEEVLDGGRYILGSQVSAFEKEFAEYCQTSNALGIANGTCALHLVLRGLGVKEGDEVITVSNSFVATAAGVSLAGGRPVFVDVAEDGNMDPNLIEAAITPKTRGIVPVHLTGRPAPMVEIMDIARRHNLFVLEDAAQAVGATLNGRRVGSWGGAACFSLHPLKNLHAYGDGGMMTTSNPDLIQHITRSRNHGLVTREHCEFFSFNCRLDEIQAAMLRVNLRHLDRRTEERRQLAFRFNELLRPYVQVPDEGPGEFHVYQTYVVQTDRRDELKAYLIQNGVEALVHYVNPIHVQPAARSLGYEPSDLPMTMRSASRILSLPLFPGMTHTQQDLVVNLIGTFCKGRCKQAA